MSASILWLVAALSAAPAPAGDPVSVYAPNPALEIAIRGQGPGFDELSAPSPGGQAAPYVPENAPYSGPQMGEPQPYAAPAPYAGNPWANDPYLATQGISPAASLMDWTLNGPEPYRFGWTSRYDTGFIPNQSTQHGLGDFGVYELDAEWRYTTPSVFDKILTLAQQFDFRAWDGPSSAPGLSTQLPAEVYRIGWDFEVGSPVAGPWFAQIGFNPSLNSDFDGALTSDAWNWDGRGIIYYRPSPQLAYAMGVGVWDRVQQHVVPYVGVIYSPNSRWEYKLVFPQPSISYFVGNTHGFSTWAYVRGEWHIEAYQVHMDSTDTREHVELEDWRVLAGIRKSNGLISTFYEAGCVFGRSVSFAHGTPGFDISSGLIVRAGLTY